METHNKAKSTNEQANESNVLSLYKYIQGEGESSRLKAMEKLGKS